LCGGRQGPQQEQEERKQRRSVSPWHGSYLRMTSNDV
jgi:hypothetical protein